MGTNNTTKTGNRYTYSLFANDVISLLEGKKSMGELPISSMVEKAQALLAAQETKAAYNATHPRKGTAKGPGADTKARADQIAGVLSSTPMTAAEINAELGTDYTALQVANAVKYIDGATSCKVVRTTINGKGLKADREYTAYTLEA